MYTSCDLLSCEVRRRDFPEIPNNINNLYLPAMDSPVTTDHTKGSPVQTEQQNVPGVLIPFSFSFRLHAQIASLFLLHSVYANYT